jgi:hypothetical protein
MANIWMVVWLWCRREGKGKNVGVGGLEASGSELVSRRNLQPCLRGCNLKEDAKPFREILK